MQQSGISPPFACVEEAGKVFCYFGNFKQMLGELLPIRLIDSVCGMCIVGTHRIFLDELS
jgi:hypothetical protein